MELQEAWRDVIRPTMRREPKTPGNRGVEVVMVDLNGDGIPDPPDPDPGFDPITTTRAAFWSNLNVYEIGHEVFANVAHFEGGNPETTTYRYRWQTKSGASTSVWENGPWSGYNDHALEVSTLLTDGGQIRFQCQAKDSSNGDQVNSFASIKDVPYLPLVCDQAPTISGEMYVGRWLTGTKAVYSGGMPPVQVESQFQRSGDGHTNWVGVDAWGQDDSGQHKIGPDEVGCYFRVAGRGIDQSGDAISQAETTMSFSEVVGPAVTPTMGEARATLDDEPYDPGIDTPTVTEGQAITMAVFLDDNDGGEPQWTWEVRSGAARLSPNGPYCVAFNETPGGNPFSVQCNFVDLNCVPTGDSVRFSMYTSANVKDNAPPPEPTWQPLYEPLGDELELTTGERHVIDQEVESNYEVTYAWAVHDPYAVNTEPDEHDTPINLENMQRLYPEMGWVEAQAAGPQLVLHCTNPPEGDLRNRFHIRFTAEVKHPMLTEPPHQYSYTAFLFRDPS